MRPTPGRIVHYVAYGTPGGEYQAGAHRAAIVTQFNGKDDDGYERVGICVINPTGLFFHEDVREDQTGQRPGSWHWPEREAE